MKKVNLFVLLSLLSLSISSCNNQYETLKDIEEEKDQDEILYEIDQINGFEKLFENDNFRFSFKESTDVIEVYDKRNNYSWKTGIDVLRNTSYCDIAYEGDRNGKRQCQKDNPVVEEGLVDSYLAMANSLITVNLYRQSGSNYVADKLASCLDGVDSKLYSVKNEENHYKFIVDYAELGYDLKVKVDIYFTDDGYDIKILNQNVTGNDANKIRNIMITPFLGSSGGIQGIYNADSRSYDISDKNFENGYVLVPDGAGSLINLTNNEIANLTGYVGNVYGVDPSHSVSYTSSQYDRMSIKDAKIPLFGITKNESKAAFVAYAKRGGEYMSINMTPDNSDNVQYAWAYPSFEYNYEFIQIFNNAGQGYSKIADNRNNFTLEMSYNFLANENANYVGMAKSYKEYLLESGQLHLLNDTKENIPIRLDFIMSDTEESLIGSSSVVTTSVDELEEILHDVHDNLNINNAIVSLQGWQKEGKSTQKPDEANFASKIGTAREFDSLIKEMKELDYDVSLAENYYLINSDQMPYLNNASKHINGYYNKFFNYQLQYNYDFAFAKASKSYEFVVKQHQKLSRKIDYDNATLVGIGAGLVSHEEEMSRILARQYIEKAYEYLKDNNMTINAITPNNYLWKYVDRYFDIDAFDSALLIENETVPFMQLVLNNTMELYSTYCNYSFYNDKSICRMIDYNIYPSFVLTNDSAYYLLKTDSWLNFSTQYEIYKELIAKVYGKVNGALSQVKNATWENRVVNDNIVTNYYSNGKAIIINYNEHEVSVNNVTVDALGYEVIDYEK